MKPAFKQRKYHGCILGKYQHAIVLIAACAISTMATGQNTPQIQPKTGETSVCPNASEVQAVLLYGAWNVEFFPETTAPGTRSDAPTPGLMATMVLEKNVEYEDSLSGWLQLGTAKIFLAGDIDEGNFSLEETDDGSRISAVWDGTLAEGSCGKAITGTRRVGETQMRFVMRRSGGWN